MANDWQVGDLALCVSLKHRCIPGVARYVSVGKIYHVTAVGRPIDWADGDRGLSLRGVSLPSGPNYGYPESLFRKVTPPEADEFDREVIELMNRKPVEA